GVFFRRLRTTAPSCTARPPRRPSRAQEPNTRPPPLSLWGEGPGVRAADSQTAMKLLTGLKALALSLTLSPVGRGNWSSGAAYSEVIGGPCLPEPPDSAAVGRAPGRGRAAHRRAP